MDKRKALQQFIILIVLLLVIIIVVLKLFLKDFYQIG
jgi:uncharacterized protein YpmB